MDTGIPITVSAMRSMTTGVFLSMVMEALERLPDAQRRRLAAESPDAITLALTSALAALAGKGARAPRKRVGARRAPRTLSATEATRRLDARTRTLDPQAPNLLGSDDFAKRSTSAAKVCLGPSGAAMIRRSLITHGATAHPPS